MASVPPQDTSTPTRPPISNNPRSAPNKMDATRIDARRLAQQLKNFRGQQDGREDRKYYSNLENSFQSPQAQGNAKNFQTFQAQGDTPNYGPPQAQESPQAFQPFQDQGGARNLQQPSQFQGGVQTFQPQGLPTNNVNQDFMLQQLFILQSELAQLRFENQTLNSKVNAQGTLNQNGGNQQGNLPSGGSLRSGGVDPQKHASVPGGKDYDITDRNTSYDLALLSSKDLGTPWRSLELLIKGRINTRTTLNSDVNSFEPWKKYITSILNSSWLTCLANINIYKVPKKEDWNIWDYQCTRGISPNVPRITYDSIMQQVDKQIPVINYLDTDGKYKTFTLTTHVDIMNTAILAISSKYGAQLIFSLYNILVSSIDEKSLRSILNKKVADITNLRETFILALKYHENNSDTMIAFKMNKFTSNSEYKMGQGESPTGYLNRLQEEADFVNSMAPTGEPNPITTRMLRNKFVQGIKQIDYLKPGTVTYDLGYIDSAGETQPYTVEKYASLLDKVYAEKKDKAATSQRDFQKGFSVQEEDENVEFGMALHDGKDDKGTPVCYSYRDTGECKFGKTCRFQHVKGNSQPKFQHKANAIKDESMRQYLENIEHEQALKLKEFKKKFQKKFEKKFFRKPDKMSPWKKKLEEQNSKGSKVVANLAEEGKEEEADATKELEEVSESNESDLSAMESEDKDE